MITEPKLQQFIEVVFNKYDTNRTGSLDANELASFFNDVFAQMGQPTRLNNQQAFEALQVIDANHDGKASKL
jgi:Ca2+-binding EF-hand superfamily protein